METASLEPSEELITAWTRQYGHIFMFTHEDVTYWYRQLTRREYRLLAQVDDLCLREEELVESCLLWPLGWKIEDQLDAPAGVISAIADQILDCSGCTDLKGTMDNHRAEASADLEKQMEAVIDHVFSGGGNFRRYQDWSYDQLFEAYARAEWVAVNLMGKRIDQQQQQSPTKRGLASKSHYEAQQRAAALAERERNELLGIDEEPIPDALPKDLDIGLSMAERPIADVLAAQRVTERKMAMRRIWEKVPSQPVLPGSS